MDLMAIWFPEEISYLKENYDKLGIRECSKELRRTDFSIKYKALQLGLKISRQNNLIHRCAGAKIAWETRRSERSLWRPSINDEVIRNVKTPEAAYFLGFFWADGYFLNKSNNLDAGGNIFAEFSAADYKQIESVFSALGKWTITRRQRENRKPVVRLETRNTPLYEWLVEQDFDKKTSVAPSKILNLVPLDFRSLWWRGYMDGDGCYYFGERVKQLSIGSAYNQDWAEFEALCESMSTTFNYQQRIQKRKNGKLHKSSSVRVCNKHGIQKLIEYFYSHPSPMGFPRKRRKAEQLLEWVQA